MDGIDIRGPYEIELRDEMERYLKFVTVQRKQSLVKTMIDLCAESRAKWLILRHGPKIAEYERVFSYKGYTWKLRKQYDDDNRISNIDLFDTVHSSSGDTQNDPADADRNVEENSSGSEDSGNNDTQDSD